MDCRNHVGMAATVRCAGCAETFCPNCVVEIHGQHYCGGCKVMTVTEPPSPQDDARTWCTEATNAFWTAMAGFLWLLCALPGGIIAIVALTRAAAARRALESNPRQCGEGLVRAAIVISAFNLLFAVVAFLTKGGRG